MLADVSRLAFCVASCWLRDVLLLLNCAALPSSGRGDSSAVYGKNALSTPSHQPVFVKVALEIQLFNTSEDTPRKNIVWSKRKEMGNCLKSPTSDDISLLHESQSDRASYGDGADPDQEPPPPYQVTLFGSKHNKISRLVFVTMLTKYVKYLKLR